MTTILCGPSETTCPSAKADGGSLWLSPSDMAAATGWELKPEGMCRGDLCVPLTMPRTRAVQRDGAIDAAAFWRVLGHPVVHDATGSVWVLGASAADRASALQSLEAPDFELPDLAGRMTSLSQHRGKKVLLATWASW